MDIPKLEDMKAYWAEFRKLSKSWKTIIIIFIVIAIVLFVVFKFKESKIKYLESTIDNLKNNLRDKQAEIQRLETQLIPFKTYALEHYPGTEKEALSQLENKIKGIGNSVEEIKDYSEISKMDFSGSPYNLAPPLQYSSTLIRMFEGCYEKKENAYYPRCGDEVEETYKKVIEKFPKFPFSYYGLALCLKDKGDKSWKTYAEKAINIFKKTTSIDGHNEQHDEALRRLQNLLNTGE
jgi:uncharacterized protein YoxC